MPSPHTQQSMAQLSQLSPRPGSQSPSPQPPGHEPQSPGQLRQLSPRPQKPAPQSSRQSVKQSEGQLSQVSDGSQKKSPHTLGPASSTPPSKPSPRWERAQPNATSPTQSATA